VVVKGNEENRIWKEQNDATISIRTRMVAIHRSRTYWQRPVAFLCTHKLTVREAKKHARIVTDDDNGKEMKSINNCQTYGFTKSDVGRKTRAAPPDSSQNTSYVTDQALATGYIGPCQTVEQNT
jgi:cystathionine beta-lyase family protein involved in aluminum resistance